MKKKSNHKINKASICSLWSIGFISKHKIEPVTN